MDYEREVVRIALLAGSEGRVEHHTFTACHIEGPAVLFPNNCDFVRPSLTGDAEALIWDVSPDKERIIGAILVEGCKFLDCRFTNIGFCGTEFVAMIREAAKGWKRSP